MNILRWRSHSVAPNTQVDHPLTFFFRICPGRVETRLKAEVPGQDASAVAAMSKRGLTVIQASQAQWRADVQGLAAAMRGAMVPNDIFDMASRERDAYRSGTR